MESVIRDFLSPAFLDVSFLQEKFCWLTGLHTDTATHLLPLWIIVQGLGLEENQRIGNDSTATVVLGSMTRWYSGSWQLVAALAETSMTRREVEGSK